MSNINLHRWHMSRRQVLRGLGVTMALPVLDCMAAATPAPSKPKRSVFLYIPNGVNTLTCTLLFLVREDEVLDTADYDMIGVLGKVSSTIRPAGTGEMIFSQMGSRRSVATRSEGGLEIAKGVEVVVTRYERGVAYVRPWEELSGNILSGNTTNNNKETM